MPERIYSVKIDSPLNFYRFQSMHGSKGYCLPEIMFSCHVDQIKASMAKQNYKRGTEDPTSTFNVADKVKQGDEKGSFY